MTGTNFGSKTESRNNCDERMQRRAERGRGFTILELMIAVAVMMILAAFAIPQAMNAVYFSRIRGAANNVSAMMQQARALAEQNNVTVPVYVANGTVGPSNSSGAFISCISGGACPGGAGYVAGDPYFPYAGTVTNAANPPAFLTQAAIGFATQPAGNTLYFTPLGAASNAAGGTFTAQGFVFYMRDNQNHWAAVSVSPTGRSRAWLYTAGSWH